MHRLILNNVGPIRNCDINISDFNVFTGTQASGKSTVAKSIFFFRTIKDDICDAIIKRNTLPSNSTLFKYVQRQLRNKFLQLFGSSRAMSNDLLMHYYFNSETYVKITLTLNEGVDYISPNYVFFDFSKNIKDFLSAYSNVNFDTNLTLKEELMEKLNSLFCDEYETIFIPAGRSLITLLTNQLNYIFTSMDEEQKRSLDFCTQKYVERILKIRPLFNNGISGYLDAKHLPNSYHNVILANKSIKLINEILKGRYIFSDGEERLILKNDRYVKINYTSSGQQETVWIFNILLYQLINDTKTFIILEEPEAHLYPDAQKKILELLALFASNKNALLITTHSPYILGAINNLVFANSVLKEFNHDKVSKIVEQNKRINQCLAHYVNNGSVKSCNDKETSLIQNEVIDGASQAINDDYDALLAISLEESDNAF